MELAMTTVHGHEFQLAGAHRRSKAYPSLHAGDVSRRARHRVRSATGNCEDSDILVVARRVVWKTEGRTVDGGTVEAVRSRRSTLATGRSARRPAGLVEVILRWIWARVVRSRPNLIIVEHRLGFVIANADLSRSNVAAAGGLDRVLLLPRDPDASAEALQVALAQHFGVSD